MVAFSSGNRLSDMSAKVRVSKKCNLSRNKNQRRMSSSKEELYDT